MNAMVADFRQWLHRPFRSDMDWLSLFLAIGLVIVMAALWSKILAHLSSRLE
jgi:hypothetical protein